MGLLLLVFMTDGPNTVRGLSESLRISKPAVTRAVDRLTKLEMVRRKEGVQDRRSVLIQCTVKVSIFLREFGEIISTAATKIPF
ncbi:MAG: MarR family transcriptional regulator [Rhodospirillaceae bacterium]